MEDVLDERKQDIDKKTIDEFPKILNVRCDTLESCSIGCKIATKLSTTKVYTTVQIFETSL